MKNFEWDDNKRKSNLKKHGIDFSKAVQVFNDPNRYEEMRFQTVGILDGSVTMVVYTNRNELKRIISARRAHEHEKQYYYNQCR